MWVVSLRELAERVSISLHPLLSHFHLLGELRIGGGDSKAVGGFRDIKLIAVTNIEASERFFGKHNSEGISHAADFKFKWHMAPSLVSTSVITPIGRNLQEQNRK